MDLAALRRHLVARLESRGAHRAFDAVTAAWPADRRGVRPDGLAHTGWELVEHLRIAQHDILAFCRDPAYAAPDWPAAYWPDTPAPPSAAAWTASLDAVRADTAAMVALVEDPATDLFAAIPHGDGQTYLREALLVADHNAYHLGQLVDVRRALGCWPPEEA